MEPDIPCGTRGFTAPAAGKTGTSHDGWFAGYTSNLLCIVWVGNDDYTDMSLSGAHTAAPIWTEFMKRAAKVPQYSDAKAFSARRAWWTNKSTRSPTSCHANLPADLYGSFHRRHRAQGDLRTGLYR